MTFNVRATKPEDADAACGAVRASIEVCCAEDHGGYRSRLDAWLKNKTPETSRGAGKAVLQAVVRSAVTSGVPALPLESTRTALAFYRRNGFKS